MTVAMRVCAVFLGLCLMSVAALPCGPAHAANGGCPTTPAKIAADPKITLPADAKISSKTIEFEIDVGSDGHVRGVQMDRSSGDGAVDLSVHQTLEAAAYDPAQTGCVTYSAGLRLAYRLPTDSAPEPTPPAKLNTHCTPYVTAFLSPGVRDRKRTGTAIVAVELDAAGTQTAAPALRKSTGSPVLDAEALRIARTGQYEFLPGSSCTPQAFTDLLELTFE
jgi:TonB family protein